VIVFDQQGHGRTPDTSREMSYEQFADDAAALLRALEVERADVMGYSQGGGVALQLSTRHSTLVSKLVSLSATFRKDGWYPSVFEAIEGIFRRYARREGVQGAHAGRQGVRRCIEDEGLEHQ
jgi:pimeloyl-ACP methyl ester carboxylesterase